jgi:hypothetical protein
MKTSNPVIKQVPIDNSDLTLRYDPDGIRAEAFDKLYPLIEVVVRDPQKSKEIAGMLAQRAIDTYEGKTAAQLRAVQEAMKTETFDQVFAEWIPNVRFVATPESYEKVKRLVKKTRQKVINSRYAHVWGVLPHRAPKSEVERAVEREITRNEILEIIRKLRSERGPNITHTDVARVKFSKVGCLVDQRSSLTHLLNNQRLNLNALLKTVDAEVEQKQIYVRDQQCQLTDKD